MAETKYAFDFKEVATIGFIERSNALGDIVIAKSVFDAMLKLAPNCKIDVFCSDERATVYFKSFHGDIKNVNLVMGSQKFCFENKTKYDLVVNVWHTVIIERKHDDRLKKLAPDLFEAVKKIIAYNSGGAYKAQNDFAVILSNIARSHILGINRYTCLSCGGALPIYDNHVEIPISPDVEYEFQQMYLKNYITIGSNQSGVGAVKRHSLKEWPASYAIKYISLLNRHYSQIEVVQIGGGGVVKLVNADRHLLDADLEIVKCVLKNSLLHVDCESGLVHLATQLGTKCLVLFGPTDEQYYGFKENFNITSDVCHPCVWAWDKGSICLRGANEPPCMLSIKPEQVFEVTRNHLEHLKLKKNT